MALEEEGDQGSPETPETDVPSAESSTAAAPEAPQTGDEDTSRESPGDAQPDKDAKPKGGFQRRISELTRKLREERERNAQLMADKAAPAKEASEAEPKREDFADWDEWDKARIRHAARQEFRRVQQEESQRSAEQVRIREAQLVQAEWESRLEDARERFDDLDEMIDEVGPKLNDELAATIKVSEVGPELVRYLGQHPSELERLAQLVGVKAVRELTRLEAKVQAAPKASRAPEPVNPVKTRAAPANALRDDMPMDAWIKKRRQEVYGGG